MSVFAQLATWLAIAIPLFLKLGLLIGALGSLIEAIGVQFNKKALVSIGQKLEAIAVDIPKLIGKLPQFPDPQGGSPNFSSTRLPKDPNPPSIPPLSAAMVCLASLVFSLSACALFESKIPALEQCAPTPAQLAQQVADILLAGGDYQSALEQQALKDGENAVLCAVHAFMTSHKVGASENETAAKARAKAYLDAKGAK